MNKIIAGAVLGLGLVMLAGCANFGPTKVLASAYAAPGAGKYELSIERDTHAGTNKVPFVVFVNGAPAAQVLGGEVVNLYLPAGRYAIGVTSRIKSDKPDMELATDVGPSHQPILQASLCAIGYCGAKLERIKE